jgi:Ca2+-binding EF-hand superfamily protein
MAFTMDYSVPACPTGTGNNDFHPKLSGHDFRQPGADPIATKKIAKDTKAKKDLEKTMLQEKAVPTLTVPAMIGKDTAEREPKQAGQKPLERWHGGKWFSHPQHEQVPLQKDQGETWNHLESQKLQGEIKGQDRLMRTVRRPEDVATPQSDAGKVDALRFDTEQYYPGRDLIDALSDAPGNDFQVRPVHLPDFYNPPPEGGDTVSRMQRIREVMKQRYAGRPGLVNVFRNCSLTKSGYIFPKDMLQVLDQMGIKVSERECNMLVKSVDKDQKGAVTFEEFADLIYGSRVNVGGAAHEPQERHVRHVTKTLVEDLIHNGSQLGTAFCEIDPERVYSISKPQFANALGTACNHISKQAVDFLWAAQFPKNDSRGSLEDRVIDWRSFMSQLAHFAHDQRPPTPCCVQGRKRQYDLLQRTAAITGGALSDIDLNRPEQNADDNVAIVADKLVHRHSDLMHHPRDAGFLTEPFVEEIRTKADRTSRALPARLPEKRLRELMKNRTNVHQDELVEILCTELENPGAQKPLMKQLPLYPETTHSGGVEMLTLDPRSEQAQMLAEEAAASAGRNPHANEASLGAEQAAGGFSGSACLQLVRADIEAYIATQRTNRDHEVDVGQFLKNVYRPPDERKVIHTVNDGLNRQIRMNRPPRERPPHEDEARYDNYWQARHMMELVNDAIAEVEVGNGGKLKPSKIFKRLDYDNDGFISLSDLRSACEKYKVPNTSADLHALFTALDNEDKGSVEIGEFTRNYAVHSGSMLDNMQKPIRAVFHEGGVENGGPVQDEIDAKEREIIAASGTVPGKEFAASAPFPGVASPGSSQRGRSAPTGSDRAGSDRAGSIRSQLSNTGSAMIYESEAARLSGKGRVSDIIRARCNSWKPHKAELYTSMAPTRYGMTIYPDTRHVTEANIPLSHSYLGENERFKTTNTCHSIFAVPDHSNPQHEDTMKKHARGEFRIERIRQRQREFTVRCEEANEAARQFDELKVARKALNQLNYERRCHMACA